MASEIILSKMGYMKTTPLKREVMCIETGQKFKSIKEASETVGISSSSIHKSITIEVKVKNLTFKYI